MIIFAYQCQKTRETALKQRNRVFTENSLSNNWLWLTWCERERWQKVLKYLYTNAYTKKGDKKWMKCHPYLWLAPHLRPSLLSCLNSRTVHRNLYAESVIICLYCCIWCDMIRLVSTFLTHNSIVWIYREKKLWSSTKIP